MKLCLTSAKPFTVKKNNSDAFASVTPIKKGSRQKRGIPDAVTFHLAKDTTLINTATKEGFIKREPVT